MLLASTLDNLSIGDAGLVAGLGYGVVFFGLILLMLVVMVMGKFFIAKDKKAADKAAVAKATMPANHPPVAAPVAEPAQPLAPGSAGQLKLYDTPPKTAAMLMAIVADKMGKPLNELRFISIKEVKEK